MEEKLETTVVFRVLGPWGLVSKPYKPCSSDVTVTLTIPDMNLLTKTPDPRGRLWYSMITVSFFSLEVQGSRV